MKLRSLFKRRLLWSIGIYKLEFRRDVLHLEPHSPIHMVGERGLRTRLANYQSTVADPFLFSFAGTLYLFYEVMGDAPHGEIWAQSMSTSGEWKVHGPVLIEGFHLSYPQVFEHQGRLLCTLRWIFLPDGSLVRHLFRSLYSIQRYFFTRLVGFRYWQPHATTN
jgi:hypothetical protein